jgi:hypothetical protein
MISPFPHREKKASAVPGFIRILQRHLGALGLNPGLFVKNLPGLIWYARDYRKYLSLRRIDDLPMGWPYPVLHERRDEAGRASGHYFHQDLWAARLIREANPTRHVDIGSRIDGFGAHLLTFREVEVFDIRPLAAKVAGLKFIQADAAERVSRSELALGVLSPRRRALWPWSVRRQDRSRRPSQVHGDARAGARAWWTTLLLRTLRSRTGGVQRLSGLGARDCHRSLRRAADDGIRRSHG